jgi:hypothetical protein
MDRIMLDVARLRCRVCPDHAPGLKPLQFPAPANEALPAMRLEAAARMPDRL